MTKRSLGGISSTRGYTPRKVLGHKNIMNTLIYTQLVDFKTDEYISKVARNAEEASA